MREPDPEKLRRSERPAILHHEGQGAVFVADASTLDSGWLRVKEWSGDTVKIPPQRVRGVRHLETEYYGEQRSDGSKPKRIAEERWREEAKDRPRTNGEQRVVADD